MPWLGELDVFVFVGRDDEWIIRRATIKKNSELEPAEHRRSMIF